jgi:hypothetical protein
MFADMSGSYTTIISNVEDHDGHNVNLKIIFKNTSSTSVKIEVFDSNGRYFSTDYSPIIFECYEKNIFEAGYYYDDVWDYLCIKIKGNGLNDYIMVHECQHSPYHLQSINNRIIEVKEEEERKIAEIERETDEKLKKLRKDKLKVIEHFYNDINTPEYLKTDRNIN